MNPSSNFDSNSSILTLTYLLFNKWDPLLILQIKLKNLFE